MKKFVSRLLVASALAAGAGTLVATAPGVALAQVAKEAPKPKPADPKADPKKPVDPKAGEAKGTVFIKAGKDDKFRFFVHDEAGKTLLYSPTGHDTEEEARKALDHAKAILASTKVTKEKGEVTKDKDKNESK